MHEKETLKHFYNTVYKKGENKHFSKDIFSEKKVPLQVSMALNEIDWKGKEVLDIGCGTGLFVSLARKAGAKRVIGIDCSEEAIKLAMARKCEKGVEFYCKSINRFKTKHKFDVIVSLGTIEHLNSPLDALRKMKNMLKEGGSLILVCPNWSNPRGYILLTLFYLFKTPITLADKHYFRPAEFIEFGKKLNMKLDFKTFDHDWAFGNKMIKDFERRLPKILPGNKNVSRFIKWLKNKILHVEEKNVYNGALGLYHFR